MANTTSGANSQCLQLTKQMQNQLPQQRYTSPPPITSSQGKTYSELQVLHRGESEANLSSFNTSFLGRMTASTPLKPVGADGINQPSLDLSAVALDSDIPWELEDDHQWRSSPCPSPSDIDIDTLSFPVNHCGVSVFSSFSLFYSTKQLWKALLKICYHLLNFVFQYSSKRGLCFIANFV